MSDTVRLSLLPSARCMFDDPLQITVTGLNSLQDVVLKASATDERGFNFSSWAEFKADNDGEVDVSRDAPLSGSYSGVQPMGLLWSMTPEVPHRLFNKNQASSPHIVCFTVHDPLNERVLVQQKNERCILGNGVQRQTVMEGRFTGVLFIPPGSGPFPAVLDIRNYPSEKRAGLLANKGFVVMTVPIYLRKPDETDRIHLDQYEAAVQYLLQHSKVGCAEVGVIGRSKAADVALSLAAIVGGVGAVVWINGCGANGHVPLFYKQRQILPALRNDMAKCVSISSDTYMVKNTMPVPTSTEYQDTIVPVEKASAQFLFVASEDDLNWDSVAYMEHMVAQMTRHGRDNYETISYPQAGHLLEPPFAPFTVSSFHGSVNRRIVWGGEPAGHAKAEVDLWKKIEDFFRMHLKFDTNKASAKL